VGSNTPPETTHTNHKNMLLLDSWTGYCPS